MCIYFCLIFMQNIFIFLATVRQHDFHNLPKTDLTLVFWPDVCVHPRSWWSIYGYILFFKVRLENIKLKNRLKKREMQLKAKVNFSKPIHLMPGKILWRPFHLLATSNAIPTQVDVLWMQSFECGSHFTLLLSSSCTVSLKRWTVRNFMK